MTDYKVTAVRADESTESHTIEDAGSVPGPFSEDDLANGFTLEDNYEFEAEDGNDMESVEVKNLDDPIDSEGTGKKVKITMDSGTVHEGWVTGPVLLGLIAALSATEGVITVKLYATDPTLGAGAKSTTLYLEKVKMESVEDITPPA